MLLWQRFRSDPLTVHADLPTFGRSRNRRSLAGALHLPIMRPDKSAGHPAQTREVGTIPFRMIHWLAAVAGYAATCATVAAAPIAAAVQIGTFQRPTYVATAPGAPTLLFVVEQAGRVRVLVNEVVQTAPFLNISDLTLGPPDTGA